MLIYGASDAVGTAVVQIAKHYDAEVTGLCNEDGMELLGPLGADHIIVYTKKTTSLKTAKRMISFSTQLAKSQKSLR